MIDPSVAVLGGAFLVAIPATITARAAKKEAKAALIAAEAAAAQTKTSNGITAGAMIELTHDRVQVMDQRQLRIEGKVDQHLADPVIHRTEWYDPDLAAAEGSN